MVRVLHLVKGAGGSEGTKPPDASGHSHRYGVERHHSPHPAPSKTAIPREAEHRDPLHPLNFLVFCWSSLLYVDLHSCLVVYCCMLVFTVVWWSSQLFDGLHCCMLVFTVVWWSSQLSDGLHSCLMVYTAACWSSQLFDGLHSCLMVFTVVWWSSLLSDGLHCCLMVLTVVWWSSQLFDGLHSCLMVFTVVWWSTLLHVGLHSCLTVFTVVWWSSPGLLKYGPGELVPCRF